MTMKINSGIWKNNVSALDQVYYDFSNNYTAFIQNVHDGYTLIGGKDALTRMFTFG